MEKTYAVAPEGCWSYLTPGKLYAVASDGGDDFVIEDDFGGLRYCLWKDCAHANGDWTRVEEYYHGFTEREDSLNFAWAQPQNLPNGNNPKQTQVGGDHYLKMKIQPLEFAMANELDACQTKIIKYICRDKSSKLEDLEKARHVLDYYIDWVKSNV